MYAHKLPQSHIETNPQHREDETQNTDSRMTARRQFKQSKQLRHLPQRDKQVLKLFLFSDWIISPFCDA